MNNNIKETFRYVVTQPDLNTHHTLHGGILMKWADEACGMSAKLYSEKVCVTRHIKKIDFLSGARLGDIVEIETELLRVGNTSLTYTAKAYCGLTRREIANFEEVVFVGIDQTGSPITVKQDDGY